MEIWQKAGDLLKKIPKDYYLPVGIGCTGLILFAYGFLNIFTKSISRENVNQPAKGSNFSQPSSLNKAVLGSSNGIKVDIEGAVQKTGLYNLPQDARVQDALIAAGGIAAGADRNWINKNVNLALKIIDGTKIYIPTTDETKKLQSSSNNSQITGETANTSTEISNNPGVTLGTLDVSQDSLVTDIVSPTPKTKKHKKAKSIAIDQSSTNSSSDTVLNIGMQSANNQQININTASILQLRTLPGVGPKTAAKIIKRRPYSSIQDLLAKKAVSKKEFGKIKDRIVAQ